MMTPLLLLLVPLWSAPLEGDPLEGEVMAAVRLVAPPEEVPRLSRYVEIGAGQPFHRDLLRRAVEIIYSTGEFEDVVVEARRPPEGLEILIHPIPAPRLTGVVVEGDAVLRPGPLQRISRLRLGEPLFPPALEAAARDAALALTAEGYLEARVSAAERPREGGADAVFTIVAGPLVTVGQARVAGAEPAVLASLEPLARPRPGEPFQRARAREAAESMQRRLSAEGRWLARVEARESYDPASGRIDLVFAAEPGPRVRAAFRGATPPGGLAGSVVALLRDGGLRGDSLEEATDRLEEEWRKKGYRDALVTHHDEADAAGRVVVFDIRPGPLSQVASVRVLGQPEGHPLPVLGVRPLEPLDDGAVDQDVRTLLRGLEDDGYAEAHVEAEVADGGGSVPVVYRVRPGPRTLVESVVVDAAPLPPGLGPFPRHVKNLAPYRARDLAQDRADLVAAYRNAGYLGAEVAPEVAFSEDHAQARVTLRAKPGEKTEVDHIVVAGLRVTKEAVVRRELLLKEGEPLGLQKVLESQRRLGALGIFDRVSITEMDPESSGPRSLVVAVEEAPQVTVAYGVGYAEQELLRGSVEVTRRNLGGLDRTLSTFVRASFRGNRFLATFREPYLIGKKQDFFATGFREEEDRDTFSFVRTGGSLQTALNFSSGWSLIQRYDFQKTRVFNVMVSLDQVDRQFRNSIFSGPSTSLIHDTRDDPLDPTRGLFVGADLQFSHKVLGGDSFLKGSFQASAYKRLNSRTLLAVATRVGLARTFESEPAELPLPDRFFAGGDYSIRGFKIDTAGPLAPASAGGLLPTGGNALLVGSAEIRFDAGAHVSVAGFSDVGNVYPLVSDVTLGDLRYAAGVGLRYKSAFGPVRIDYGYKLNRRPGESPGHIHFTIGHAF